MPCIPAKKRDVFTNMTSIWPCHLHDAVEFSLKCNQLLTHKQQCIRWWWCHLRSGEHNEWVTSFSCKEVPLLLARAQHGHCANSPGRQIENKYFFSENHFYHETVISIEKASLKFSDSMAWGLPWGSSKSFWFCLEIVSDIDVVTTGLCAISISLVSWHQGKNIHDILEYSTPPILNKWILDESVS